MGDIRTETESVEETEGETEDTRSKLKMEDSETKSKKKVDTNVENEVEKMEDIESQVGIIAENVNQVTKEEVTKDAASEEDSVVKDKNVEIKDDPKKIEF